MHVKVLLFAGYREAAGSGELEVQIEEGGSVRSVAARLEGQFDGLDLSKALCAVNEVYASPDQRLAAGDTVALFPPVAGGSTADHFVVTEGELDIGGLMNAVRAPEYGALASFVGSVRSPNAGATVEHIDYEGYEAMMLREMQEVAGELRSQFDLGRLAVAHRLGRLSPGEASIAIVVSSRHRREALAACQACIDRLKERLPVWKYESGEAGSKWVAGKRVEGSGLSADE